MTADTAKSPQRTSRFIGHYDDSDYYAYLLLSSAEPARPLTHADVRYVKEKLRVGGIEASASGPSYRPAANGKKYEWYIRVAENGLKPARERMAAVLKERPAAGRSETSAADSYTGRLRELVGEQRQENGRLREQIQDQESTLTLLTAKIAQLEDELQHAAESRELGAAERERPAGESGSDRAAVQDSVWEIEMLTADNRELREKSVELQNRISSLSTDLEIAAARRLDVEQQLAELQAEHDRLRLSFSQDESAPSSVGREFEAILSCLLPEVEFMSGSCSVLVHEVRDYRPALKEIKAIIAGEATPRPKPVKRQGHGTWLEYDFKTGRSNDGRIYAQKSDGRYTLLVGTKATQNRDIKRLG